MKKITVIPSTIDPFTKVAFSKVSKRRVAAYARVSTDSDEQLTSYEAQIDYYKNFIKNKPDWEFVHVYSDEGISATNTKNREGFKQMISDAIKGEIDLIVTKSISRFARNTVDTLVAIRKLKEKGVECYFEKENIYTFDSKGELLITIMSSLAQEESRSLSQNVTWGIRKSFSDGNVRIAYKNFLGYKRGADGRPEIIPEEAAIVRKIYYLFLIGKSEQQIARLLEAEDVKAPMGGKKWYMQTIKSILKNEKYKGDALLQKQFTVDYLEKKTKINEGEVPQYYVENSHEAIIPVEEWDMVQEELKRRSKLGRSFRGTHVFSNRLICGDCGAFYGPKVWHSNSKYRSERWQCNRRLDNKKNGIKCETPYLTEEQIKKAFIEAFNKLNVDKDKVINHCNDFIKILDNFDELDLLIREQKTEVDIIDKMATAMVMENATSNQDQNEYRIQFSNIEKRYNEAHKKLDELLSEKKRKEAQVASLKAFMNSYKNKPEVLVKWSDSVFKAMIDKIIINDNGTKKLIFKSGYEVRI